MSGCCPECGNTLCICSEYEKNTYPFRVKIQSLEARLRKAENMLSLCSDWVNSYDDLVELRDIGKLVTHCENNRQFARSYFSKQESEE